MADTEQGRKRTGGKDPSCAVVTEQKEAPPGWMVECLSRLFSALADPTRVRMVHALTTHEELCVADLAGIVGLSVSAVSQQLRILRDRNLVHARRSGRMVFYSLADDHLRELINTGVQHACQDCRNRPKE